VRQILVAATPAKGSNRSQRSRRDCTRVDRDEGSVISTQRLRYGRRYGHWRRCTVTASRPPVASPISRGYARLTSADSGERYAVARCGGGCESLLDANPGANASLGPLLAIARSKPAPSTAGRPDTLTPREPRILLALAPEQPINRQMRQSSACPTSPFMHHSVAIYRSSTSAGAPREPAWKHQHGLASQTPGPRTEQFQ